MSDHCFAPHCYTSGVRKPTAPLRPWLRRIMPGLTPGSGMGESGSLHQQSVGFSCFSMRALGWSGLMLWKCNTVDSGTVCYGRGTNSSGSGQRKEVESTASAAWDGRVADAQRLRPSAFCIVLGWRCFVIFSFLFMQIGTQKHFYISCIYT